jgi:hypothetical protein
MTTHKAIQNEIKVLTNKVSKLYQLESKIKDEETPKICSRCGTKNLFYYVDGNIWVCAYC